MFTLGALRALYSRKNIHVVENRCLQCVESIVVNLPQFAKSGWKESLNRFFWYLSLHLFVYFGLVSSLFVFVSVCFTVVLSMAAPLKRTVGRLYRRGCRSTLVSVNPSFLISGEMGKKLLAANSTDSVFAEFLLCPVEISWKQNKRVNLTWTMLYLIWPMKRVISLTWTYRLAYRSEVARTLISKPVLS